MSVQMSRNESTPRWYYYINGQEFGPFPSAMMADWMRDGWLRDDLQLRTENEQHCYTLGHYKATCGGYPFNLSLEPSIPARGGSGGYEFGSNQQLSSAQATASMGVQPHYSYPPPFLARPINFVGNAGYGPFPPPPMMMVPQQLRGAAAPVFQTAAPSPPVHVVAKVRTEPIQIAASRAEAVLSELLQIPVKIISAMLPPSSSTSAGDEKRRGGAD